MANQDYNTLVQKYAAQYNLDATLVRKILENLPVDAIPSDTLSKAVSEGIIATSNPAELDPESAIKVGIKYISDLSKDTKTGSPVEVMSRLQLDVPTFASEQAYVSYLNVVDPATNNPNGTPDTSQAYYQVQGANNAPDDAPKTSGVNAEQYMGMGMYNDTTRPSIPVDSTGQYTPTADATVKSSDGFADPISFDGLYNRLDDYDENLEATLNKVNTRQATIDTRNSTLSLEDIDVAGAYQAKSNALGQTADDYSEAQKTLQAGMQTNQDKIVEAYNATFKDANLDVTDPNHNSLVQAYRLENQKLSEDALRASASARKLRTAPVLSRASMGMMIFGNVYEEGLKDTVSSQKTLNDSYKAIMDVNKRAYDNSLLTNVNKDDLKVAYEATINTIKARNTQRVFDATKDIATFKTKSDLINAMNTNDIQAMNNDLKVLELSGKGVDTESKVVELRLKQIKLSKEASKEKDTAYADSLRNKQLEVNLANTTKAGVRADTEYNAKVASGAYDRDILANKRQTAVNVAKTNKNKSEAEAAYTSSEEYKDQATRQLALSTQAATTEAKAAISKANVSIIKAGAMSEFYKKYPNTLTTEMLSDKLTAETTLASLQASQEALAGVDLTEVKRLELEANIAKDKETLANIQLKIDSGYPKLQIDSAIKRIEADNKAIDKDKQLEAALIKAYGEVTGDPTVNNVPSYIRKNAKLQQAILNYDMNGTLDPNPLAAMAFARQLIPNDGTNDASASYDYLVTQLSKPLRTKGGVQVNVAEDAATVKTEINRQFINQDDKVIRKLDEVDTPFGFKDFESINISLSKQDVELSNGLANDNLFQEEYRKSLSPKEKMQSVIKGVMRLYPEQRNNIVFISGKSHMFTVAALETNNVLNRLDLLGLTKQDNMKVKSNPIVPTNNTLTGSAYAEYYAASVRGIVVDLSDASDIAKLITYNYFDLNDK